MDFDLDSVVDFVFVVQTDVVVVGLELGFLIVVFVKDRLLICSNLLFLLLRKHKRDQINLEGRDLIGLKRLSKRKRGIGAIKS